MRWMARGMVLSVAAATALSAAGYKLPEQSINSVALAAAYVAHTTGADSAYYNPANMSFLDPQSQFVEADLTWVHLPAIEFDGTVGGLNAPADSEVENIPVGHLHYVSKAVGNWRFGVSVVAPGGLSKRWESPIQKLTAEEFTLKIMELNPSVAYKINDNFSVAAGVRMVYTDGVVKSDGIAPTGKTFGNGEPIYAHLKRDMEGDVVAFGYNLALAYRPTDDIELAVTYRSKVDLDVDGNAKLDAELFTLPSRTPLFSTHYDNQGDVSVPLPATLSLAVAKTFDKRLTLEFVYERVFWSAYKTLDFNYNQSFQKPNPLYKFDEPLDKNWKDTNTYRFGLTYLYNDKLTLMAGYAYDETPVPEKSLGFELPDSDGHVFSAGFRYKQTENLEWGAAILYDYKVKRSVSTPTNDYHIDGTFKKGGALLTTVGFQYRF